MVEDFKNTDAGIIPNDWNAPLLSEISDFENGKAHEQFIDDKGDYVVVNSKFISQEGRVAKYSKENLSPLAKGSIAIVMSDIPNGKALAKCFSIDKDNHYTLNQRIGSIIPFDEIDNDYLFYKLNRNKYFLSFDSGSGQTNLKKSEILACPVALPPTKDEQTEIATAIKDADALINQLEQLLTKKRNIKTGAMQELLKPKEGWELKKLGDEIDFQGGSQPPLSTFIPSEKEGYIRLLQIRDYKTDDYKTYIPLSLSKRFCNKDDIMIGRYGPPVFQILKGLEGSYNVALMKAVPSKNVYKDFAYYFLKQDSLFSFIETLSKRTAGQSGIDMKELKAYPFHMPPFNEQKRIAQILSDMDTEIQELEKKLEKYKMLKQGMMQSLLTGKIRLV